MAHLSDDRRARYRQELAASETSFRDKPKMVYFKPPTGTTKVRVLPGIDPSTPDKDFYCKAGTHYWANPSNPKLPVPCSKTKNPKATCLVCDKSNELKASTNKADNIASEKIRVKVRYYMGIIPREGDDAGKVMVYPAPKAIYTKILSYMEDPEYGDVTNPADGCDINIIRSGSGMETKYDTIAARASSPISNNPDEVEAILKTQPELWRFREAPDQEEVAQFMAGTLDRFSTGGFASKPSGVVDLETFVDTPPVPVAVSEQEEETEEIPVFDAPAEKKTKKFSNIDKIRDQLK